MKAKGIGSEFQRRAEEVDRRLRNALKIVLHRASERLIEDIMTEVARADRESAALREEDLRNRVVAAITSAGVGPNEGRSGANATKLTRAPRIAKAQVPAGPGKLTAMEFVLRHLAEQGPATGAELNRAGKAAGLGKASLVKARTRARAAGHIVLEGDTWTRVPAGN